MQAVRVKWGSIVQQKPTRIPIQAVIESGDGMLDCVMPISVLERIADHAPASCLGMLLREGRQVLRTIQTVLVEEQVRGFEDSRRSQVDAAATASHWTQGLKVDCLSVRLRQALS